MAKFEDTVKKMKANKPEPNVGGSFDCQYCDEHVEEAYYEMRERYLLWWCSKGHMSSIEEF